ncbi:terpenoid synthase [Trametes polyzona]|nr:terpenoid synthase [Trametes polyzona]
MGQPSMNAPSNESKCDCATNARTADTSSPLLENSSSLVAPSKRLEGSIAVLQGAVRDLLDRCAYQSPKSATDPELRRALAEEVAKWDVDTVSPAFLAKAVNASCNYVETVYGHTPAAHRLYIGLYCVCMFYADDLGAQDPDAVVQFTRRFVRGEPQPHAVFECLAGVLRRAHELWPQFGADCLITGTLDALATNHIETTTVGMAVKPLATRYPEYLRLRAGIGAPFTHFVFPNTWRETPESYIQILPEIDHWTLGANLSFYKEEIAGETTNYIHLRAAAEQMSTDDVLRKLVNEVSDTAQRVNEVVRGDAELSEVWHRYKQCYLEFHLKTPRYRLAELGFSA